MRIAVISAGAVGREVVDSLDRLGAVALEVFDAGDFWDTLTLGRLQDFDCAVAAVEDARSRLRLGQLCRIAGVDLVCTAADGHRVTIETFPFGTAPGAACCECARPEATGEVVPGTAVAARAAGALAASVASRLGSEPPAAAQRSHFDTIGGEGRVAEIVRRDDCPDCGAFRGPPCIVRTRNRWSPRIERFAADDTLAELPLRLSDPLVTAVECAACGPLPEAAAWLNRRASDLDESVARCPRCASPDLRVEIRDSFRLGELMQRFGSGPVPGKFALAEIGGRPVCFDLEDSPKA